MNNALRITVVQLNYKVGDFAGNVTKIVQAIEAAGQSDMLVYSELCLSGYSPFDLLDEPGFLPAQDRALASVLEASRKSDAAIVIGLVTRNQSGTGKALHNSLAVVQNGAVTLTYNKQLLPTYDIFDERRHFEPGHDATAVLVLKGQRIGFLICEDGWNDASRDYAANPVRTLMRSGIHLLVSLNASPSNIGKTELRRTVVTSVARRYGVPVLYANQVGGYDQIVFDGASFAAHDERGIVFEMASFEEEIRSVLFDGTNFYPDGCTPSATTQLTVDVRRSLPESEFYYRQICLGLKDYMAKTGFSQVVVGSSGGIDSALTLALAVDTLGADAVRAITMPSPFSSVGSVEDSKTLCQNLGLRLYEHPIDKAYDVMMAGFKEAFGEEADRITRENVQSRLRGAVLMEFSNHYGVLLLSTGNKSEISVGYATLYGDMNGGLNLIGDLFKTEVYALARHYNERHGRLVIPEVILNKEPSPELSAGQKDTDSLPPYPVLDEILKLLIEGTRLRPAEYQQALAANTTLRERDGGKLIAEIAERVTRAEFKRQQAAPIIRVRNRAFGAGRQLPITAATDALNLSFNAVAPPPTNDATKI